MPATTTAHSSARWHVILHACSSTAAAGFREDARTAAGEVAEVPFGRQGNLSVEVEKQVAPHGPSVSAEESHRMMMQNRCTALLFRSHAQTHARLRRPSGSPSRPASPNTQRHVFEHRVQYWTREGDGGLQEHGGRTAFCAK